jgi:predicted nucleic acid-binding protein
MPVRVVVDSGPLVALFDRDDANHGRAVQFVRTFVGELVSNIAVVTEVCYLLDFSRQAQDDFLRWIERGGITLMDLPCKDFGRIADLIEKYGDLPSDFADASLVVICDRLAIRDVASFDRDFAIYRYRQRQSFRNVFDPGV